MKSVMKIALGLSAACLFAVNASAHSMTIWVPENEMLQSLTSEWAEFVGEGSNGEIDISFTELDAGAAFEAVKSGEIDMALISPKNSDAFNPFSVFELPVTALSNVTASQAAADFIDFANDTQAFEGTVILSAWLDMITFTMTDEILGGDMAALMLAFLEPATWQGTSYQLVMNAEAYNALALDLQSVIDENSGRALAEYAATKMSEVTPEKSVIVNLQTLASLPPEAQAILQQKVRPVVSDWISQADQAGYNGYELLETSAGLLKENN